VASFQSFYTYYPWFFKLDFMLPKSDLILKSKSSEKPVVLSHDRNRAGNTAAVLMCRQPALCCCGVRIFFPASTSLCSISAAAKELLALYFSHGFN
jgi:hypothetical protein